MMLADHAQVSDGKLFIAPVAGHWPAPAYPVRHRAAFDVGGSRTANEVDGVQVTGAAGPGHGLDPAAIPAQALHQAGKIGQADARPAMPGRRSTIRLFNTRAAPALHGRWLMWVG